MKRSKKPQSNVSNTMQSGTANDNNNTFLAVRGWLLEKLYYSGVRYLKNDGKGSVLKKLPEMSQLLLEKKYYIDSVNGIVIKVNFATNLNDIDFRSYDEVRHLGCGQEMLKEWRRELYSTLIEEFKDIKSEKMKDDMIEYNSRLLCALYQDTSFSSDIPDFTILKAKNLLKDNFTKKRNYCIDIVNGIPINVNFAIDKDNVKFQLYDGLRYLGCGNDVLASMQEKTLTHSISTDMNGSASFGINRKAIVPSKMSITDSSKKVDEGLEDMARLLLALYKKADPIFNKETEGSERDILLKTIRKTAPFTQEKAKYLLEESFRETGTYYIDEVPIITLYKDNPHSVMQKIGYVPIDVDFSLLHFTDYDVHVGEKGCGQKILESYRNILKGMQVDSPSSILTSYAINEWKENKGGEETKTSELDKAKIVKLKNALDNYSGDININCTNEYGRKIVTKIEASELKKADLSELEYAIENHCNPIGVSYGERVNLEINIGFVKTRYLCKRIQDMQKEK